MKYRKLFIILKIFFSSLVITSPGFGMDNSLWEFTIGTKGVYSSGVSDANAYYKPYARIGYRTGFFGISVLGGRYIHYQVSNGYGDYDCINFNEAETELSITAFRSLQFSIEYRYASGESDYKQHSYSFEASYDFKKISIIGDYSLFKTEYLYDSLKVNRNDYEYSFEIDYLPSERVSLDLSYSCSNVHFDTLGYDYSKRLIRTGAMPEVYESVFIIGGISAGRDSEDYNIFGCDAGISAYLNKYFKLIVLYAFEYYQPPGDYKDETGTKGNGSGTDSDSSGRNPFLSDDRIGESYTSHKVSIGLSLVF